MVIEFNPGSTNDARSNQSSATAGKRDVAADRPANSQNSNPVTAGDSQVQLSSQAQQLQAIEDRLRELPEVDSARVEQIKQAIADGSYQPDSNRIADKLIALES